MRWYADRLVGETPAAGVLSLPQCLYRVGMLVWALWQAESLVRAIGWGWRSFGEGGLWRKLTMRRATPTGPADPTDAGADTPASEGEDEDSPQTLD